eukprot:jgi/Galph1/6000/GphlegSOOS_G4703.1
MVNTLKIPSGIRSSQLILEQEDATVLQLGDDFSSERAQPLTISEVSILLSRKREMLRELEGPRAEEFSSVFKKFLEYVERFDRYKGLEAATNVRNLLQRHHELHPFEVASLANLCPADAEEAKTIIPSLKDKIDDSSLNQLLQDLASFTQ